MRNDHVGVYLMQGPLEHNMESWKCIFFPPHQPRLRYDVSYSPLPFSKRLFSPLIVVYRASNWTILHTTASASVAGGGGGKGHTDASAACTGYGDRTLCNGSARPC
jgi:hypothetical protein